MVSSRYLCIGRAMFEFRGIYREPSRAELPSRQVNRLICGPEFARHSHQVGEGIRFHFLHDPPAVRLYRDFADTQFRANLFIEQTGDNQGHDLPFSKSQRCVAVPKIAHRHFAVQCHAAAFEAFAYHPEQHFIADRLDQEIDSPGFHRFYRRWNISVAGNEDDRHLGALARDYLLRFESIQVGKREVEDETARDKRPRSTEEFAGRPECLRLPAFAPNQ